MCGIIGILGREPVAEEMVEALKRLEYRGYDSAGVATLEGGHLTRRRAEGKLKNLEKRLAVEPLAGTSGIGHTRWATHGRPNEVNAHPHATDKVAVVHNGIIENFSELREELKRKGVKFSTETDTEVVAHLVTDAMRSGRKPVDAVKAALPRLRGAFALAFLFEGEEDLLIGARNGPPLAVGYGKGEMYLGSDAIALAPFTDTISYLEDGDWAVVQRNGVQVHDSLGHAVVRPVIKSAAGALLVDKGNHRHFMAKEIHEQPEVVGHTLAHYLDMAAERVRMPLELPFDFARHYPHFDFGLRHRLLRRPGREILVRAFCASARGNRRRFRVSLPRGAVFARRACDLRVAVGRDRRHARDVALRQGAEAAHSFRRERADVDHRPRKRCRAADAGRSRDRRRIDQGVHLPALGAGMPCDSRPDGRAASCPRRTSASWCVR